MKKRIFLLMGILFLLTGCKKYPNPIVTMEFEDYGEIKIELYQDVAPNTVANFVDLVQDKFYDGLTIHRIVPGFVIQGGDPLGNGTGGPGYTIKGEFALNGYSQNGLNHTRGVISMAREAHNFDSAGSQFFIVLDNSASTSLNQSYAGFGMVTSGMDIIDKMVSDAVIVDEKSGLIEKPIKITKATVETFGKNYKVKKITN